MRKTLVGVVIAALVAVAAVVSYGLTYQDSTDLNMNRMHGSVSTTMGSPVLGSSDAPVTIVEFGDYQCHACHNWFHNIKPAIQENYIDTGRANLVFLDMAFLGRDSPVAAQATYCAQEQGAYWEYHDRLYEEQQPQIDGGWASRDNLKAIAADIGMDKELFDACLDSNKYEQRVRNNMDEGLKHGVNSTPTFIIVFDSGAERIVKGAQPYSVFDRILSES